LRSQAARRRSRLHRQPVRDPAIRLRDDRVAGKSRHLASAIAAVSTPIDNALVAELLALRPADGERQWISGLPANN
jgi:hypothetical protein